VPKARNPNRDKAKEIWLANTNIPLREIADKLGETESTIRKWKSLDGWERSDKNAPINAPKKQSSGKGKKRAPSAGAPQKNVNAKTHGGYAKIYWDTLTAEEKALIDELPKDEERLLIDQIRLYSVRERRILTAINRYKDADLVVDGETETGSALSILLSIDENDEENEFSRESQNINPKLGLTITKESGYKIIQRLERELTSVQRAKTKAIEALMRYNLNIDKDNDADKINQSIQRLAELLNSPVANRKIEDYE